MKNVVVIRNRGQLTIPDAIRKAVNWATPMSAVTISVTKPDEIVIKPHQKYVDWEKVWNNIKECRSIKGKGFMNASEFIEQDRNSH